MLSRKQWARLGIRTLAIVYFPLAKLLKSRPETAALGEFLEWLVDMSVLALVNLSLMIAIYYAATLVRGAFAQFRVCITPILGRANIVPPNPTQLEAGEPNVEGSADLVSRGHLFITSPRPRSRCLRLCIVIVCGSIPAFDFIRRDLLKDAGVQDGVSIMLKHVFRGFAAMSAMLVLSVAAINMHVPTYGQPGDQTALATAVNEMDTQSEAVLAEKGALSAVEGDDTPERNRHRDILLEAQKM